MTLSANRHSKAIVGDVIELPVYTGVHIYAGGFVCVQPSHGYAIPGADTLNNICMGIAESEADNTNGDSGDIVVRVRRKGVFRMAASSIAITSHGVKMYLVDAQTFDEGDPGQAVECGVLVGFISATEGWLDIGRQSSP
jgi:hypothetical protein